MYNFQILYKNKNKEQKINYILECKYLDKSYIYYTPYFDTELTNEELNDLFVQNIDNYVYDYTSDELSSYSSIIDIFKSLHIVEIEIPDSPIVFDAFGNIINN